MQFLVKLLDFWKLEPFDAVGLLGFDIADADHVSAALDGREQFRGRDVSDRIAYLFSIRATLRSLFRNLEVENDWLREPHAMLGRQSPLSLLLGGSMEDILLVKEYVDAATGRYMTESEQDAVIGQAFREHQEAAKEFACIRVTARRTADTLKQVAESVQKIADAESVTKPRLSDYPAPDDLADLF